MFSTEKHVHKPGGIFCNNYNPLASTAVFKDTIQDSCFALDWSLNGMSRDLKTMLLYVGRCQAGEAFFQMKPGETQWRFVKARFMRCPTWPRAERRDHSQDADVAQVGHPGDCVLEKMDGMPWTYNQCICRERSGSEGLEAICVWNEVSEQEEDLVLTWKLRKTVSRLKNKAMAEKPKISRGFLPIRSITKPWGQVQE